MKIRFLNLFILIALTFSLSGFTGEKGGNMDGKDYGRVVKDYFANQSCPEEEIKVQACEYVYQKELRILQRDFMTDLYLSSEELEFKSACCKEKKSPRTDGPHDEIF